MKKLNTEGISRRHFIAGGVASGSLLMLASLGGCAPQNHLASTESRSSETDTIEASETKQADIVVVGSGPAGLSAAIEAAEQGASVILLESQNIAGGNLDGTEGLMGVNSAMMIAQDGEMDPMEIVNSELRSFSYRVDALKWKDLVDASGENIQWMIDHGVKFASEVGDYSGKNGPHIYHWWEEGSHPSEAMVAAAEQLGCEILLETTGKKLIAEDGKIKGIYAQKSDDSFMRIDAGAIIIATGGYVNNDNMISKIIHQDQYYTRSTDGHYGEGVEMAVEAGAKSMLSEQTLMAYPAAYIDTNRAWYDTWDLLMSGLIVWVNQDGLRFTNESCTDITMGLAVVTCMTQQKTYTLCDSSVLASFGDSLQKDLLDGGVDAGESHVWRGETWEEVAQMSGVDPATLLDTIETYNASCRAGKDVQYQKPAEKLMELATPPFYMIENTYYITTTIGGLDYDREMHVLDEYGEAIPGLFVAGVDGAQIYKSYYTIDTSGSANANNIYTGRKAAQTAVSEQ